MKKKPLFEQSDACKAFLQHFQGRFENVLRWSMLDNLVATINCRHDEAWYLYAVGETPPKQPAERKYLDQFLSELSQLLRAGHQEDYCGIVYADDLETPTMVKIFDPNNLGASCGSSGSVVLPGWVISQIPPCNLPDAFPQPGNRKRWWQSLF